MIIFPNTFYSTNLKTINEIQFTQREIDVMSFLLNGRASKKIASFLDISVRTVETHMRNVMLKANVHSKEGIVDFVEKSNKLGFVKQYYSLLFISESFAKMLKEVSTGSDKHTCILLHNIKASDTRNPLIYFIKKHLEMAGISVSFSSKNNPENVCFPQNNGRAFVVICDDQKTLNEQELKNRNACNPIHVLLANSCNDGYEYTNDPSKIAFDGSFNDFFSLFKLLEKIISFEKVNPVAIKFRGLYEQHQLPNHSVPHRSPSIASHTKNDKLSQNFWERKLSLIISIIILTFSTVTPLLKNYFFNEPTENREMINKIFLQRPKLLQRIDDCFRNQKGVYIIALVGPGGAGKTSTARLYVQRKKPSFFFEISAQTKEKLHQSFMDLCKLLIKTPEDERAFNTIKEIKDSLEKERALISFVKERIPSFSHWMLIYDNVVNLEDVKNYLPQVHDSWGDGNIIITTQNYHIQNGNRINDTIEISELSAEEKSELFNNIMKYEKSHQNLGQDAVTFLQNIPSFPLDVSIAAYYIKTTGISYEEYLRHLREAENEFFSLQQTIMTDSTGYEKTRYGVVSSAVQKIIQENKEFEEILFLISFLDSQSIPKDLLTHYKNDIMIDKCLYYLKKYSLISIDASSKLTTDTTFSIHRSTQEMLLHYLTKLLKDKEKSALTEKIVHSIDTYATDLADKGDLSRMVIIKNHLEKMLTNAHLITNQMKNLLKGDLGYIHYYLGHYLEAEKLLQESVHELQRYKDKQFDKIARFLVYLADARWDLGLFTMAKTCLKESAHIYETYLPHNKPGLAKALKILGMIHHECEEFEEAIFKVERSIELYKKYAPENKMAMAEALTYLGVIHRRAGNFPKAIEAHNKGITIYQKYSKKDHVDYAWALFCLGNVKKDRGEYYEALSQYEKSLAIYKKNNLGYTVAVGRILAHLGTIYRGLGQYDRSLVCFNQAIEIFKNNIQDSHVAFAWTFAQLGELYRVMGDFKKSVEMLERSFLIYKQNLPANHTEVARAKMFFAGAQAGLGNFEKAMTLSQEALDIYQKNYGRNHTETAHVIYVIGHIFLLKRDYNTALSYLEEAMRIFESHSHTDKYLAMEDLSTLLIEKNKIAREANNSSSDNLREARYLLSSALSTARKNLAKNSPALPRITKKIKEIDFWKNGNLGSVAKIAEAQVYGVF